MTLNGAGHKSRGDCAFPSRIRAHGGSWLLVGSIGAGAPRHTITNGDTTPQFMQVAPSTTGGRGRCLAIPLGASIDPCTHTVRRKTTGMSRHVGAQRLRLIEDELLPTGCGYGVRELRGYELWSVELMTVSLGSCVQG